MLFCLVLVSAVDLCARRCGAGSIDVSEVVLLMPLMCQRLCC